MTSPSRSSEIVDSLAGARRGCGVDLQCPSSSNSCGAPCASIADGGRSRQPGIAPRREDQGVERSARRRRDVGLVAAVAAIVDAAADLEGLLGVLGLGPRLRPLCRWRSSGRRRCSREVPRECVFSASPEVLHARAPPAPASAQRPWLSAFVSPLRRDRCRRPRRASAPGLVSEAMIFCTGGSWFTTWATAAPAPRTMMPWRLSAGEGAFGIFRSAPSLAAERARSSYGRARTGPRVWR